MKIYITILVATLFLSGCASTKKYQEERSAVADEATVYIIREYAEPTAFRVNVFCDDQNMAQVANRSYTGIHLKEGTRKIYIAWPPIAVSTAKFPPVSIEIKPNEERYFLVAGKITPKGVNSVTMAGMTPILGFSADESLSLAELPPDIGRELIQKIKEPKK